MMNRFRILWAAALLVVGSPVMLRAQEAEITDEDLKNYAIIELAKNSIVSSISPMVNGLIEKQEGMTGNRFQELSACKGDQAKLTAANAQEWELKFLEVVNGQVEKRRTAAGDVVKLLAGNALGAAKYKAIKDGIDGGGDVKARYDAIWDKMNN
jgi:hypothetical protein